MVKEVSFRYPNARADEIGYSEFHEVLRVIVRADAMVKPEKMATVFEFSSTLPRPPIKARSANAKPEENCEIHPNAKVPHTNGECRQNEANPKFKLKFQKRERVEEGHKKVSKPKYDSDQKVLFIEEEESDIDEIYLTQSRNILCDTNNMLGVGRFPPNKNSRIQIPRRAEVTDTQLDVDPQPLTYDGLMKWHEQDRSDPKGRQCHFLESSSDEEESSSSSDWISVDSDELFRKTGIERWPPKPTALGARPLRRNKDGEYVDMISSHDGEYVDMISSHVEPTEVITEYENYLYNMAYLANLTMDLVGEDTKRFDPLMADCPMEFEWSDKHEAVPDGGWTIAHEEEELSPHEEEEMSPAAKASETEVNSNHI